MIYDKIKSFFKNNPSNKETANQIAENLSITRETASRHLNKLVKEDYLEKDTLKPRSFWLRSQSQSQSQSLESQSQSLESQSQSLESQSQSLESQSQLTFENESENEIYGSKLKDQLTTAEKELANGIEEFNESKSTIEDSETSSNLKTEIDFPYAEEMRNANEEIQKLELEIAFAKGINKRPFTFKEFSEFMLSKARKTGSNSYKIGEIAFRKSDLKNIYLIILYLREVSQL